MRGGDLKVLSGDPRGYTPMCESREETKGYQFWREGFWLSRLRGRPYHISVLYMMWNSSIFAASSSACRSA